MPLAKYYIAIFISASIMSQSQTIKWSFDTFDSAFGQSAMADLDGDGNYEIVFGCYRNDSSVYVINAEDGSLLWKYNTSALNSHGCNDTAPLIFDVDNDGILDVIVASSCNPTTYCFDGKNGNIKWQTSTKGSDSPPTIADINGDGLLEILHGQFGGYVVCLDALTGNMLWDLEVDANSWVQTAPSILDLDNDGIMDFVVATWNFDKESKVYAYRGYDRKLLWTYDVNDYVYHGMTILDIDKDGDKEIIVGDYGSVLSVLSSKDGDLKWNFTSPYYIPSPIIAGDINGDGNCELVFTSYFKVYALSYDGSIIWEYDIPDYGQSFRGVALSDMDNDDLPDVVFATTKGMLISLSGINGKEIWSIDLAKDIGKEFDINHAPVIADMDNDGYKEVFVVGGKTEYPNFQNNYGRAYCIGTNALAGDEWLMFQNNIHRTGSICVDETSTVELDDNNRISFKHSNNLLLLSNLDGSHNYNIIDMRGAILIKGKSKSAYLEIDISDLSSGAYILSIDNQKFKFIK